ncbi:blue copper protein 1b-like [Impatiens glandulifera]|uniref:blue copper protein 1b-like n=1 Tax=Impatiens glandulifera TaxID=253017 RepID=UPI001FB19ACD|nr:blue copper protein 1b-like [Impatiens glandulifera]
MAITKAFILLVLVLSILELGLANNNDFTRSRFQGCSNVTNGPRNIIVGGSNNWTFGFNYTDWALKNGPFYIGDSLVFKFNPPTNDPNSHPHSVYRLRTYQNFVNCDLKRAKKIAGNSDGAGQGFSFRLKTCKPHYFSCGEKDGLHCNMGMMKFPVFPLIPSWHK